jgi:hypothetical protein
MARSSRFTDGIETTFEGVLTEHLFKVSVSIEPGGTQYRFTGTLRSPIAKAGNKLVFSTTNFTTFIPVAAVDPQDPASSFKSAMVAIYPTTSTSSVSTTDAWSKFNEAAISSAADIIAGETTSEIDPEGRSLAIQQ